MQVYKKELERRALEEKRHQAYQRMGRAFLRFLDNKAPYVMRD
jgi:hypothetical protein